MVSKLLPQEGVEDRADAAVQVGKVAADVQGVIESVGTLGFVAEGRVDGLQQDDHVVGRPAEEEGENDDEDEFDRPALLLHAGGHDPDADAKVAVQDHAERNGEEKEKLLVMPDQLPLLDDFLGVTGHFTQHPVRTLLHVEENHILHAGQYTDEPDGTGGGERVHLPPAVGRRDGVDHRKVPVERHQREEEDGAVEADGVETAHQLAHDFAEDPFRAVVHCPEGKGEGEDQV